MCHFHNLVVRIHGWSYRFEFSANVDVSGIFSTVLTLFAPTWFMVRIHHRCMALFESRMSIPLCEIPAGPHEVICGTLQVTTSMIAMDFSA